MAMQHPGLDSLSNGAYANGDNCHGNQLMDRCASKALRRLRVCILLFCFAGMAGHVHPAEGTRQQLVRDDRVLEIDISPQFSESMRQNLVEWLNFIATSLQQVYGHWPRQRWQISVAPTSAGSDDPIPWAQVHRGEPDRVEFFIAAQASVAELKRAWTGYHELAHLLIPYRGSGDAWFSEGLASYYQNLLQARHGVFDEREMWQRLHDGFIRGRSNRRPDLSLQELSERRYEVGGTMRMYWSGAWYFLAADAELRRRSNGSKSLDSALLQLNNCCREQSLSARQIAARLDQLSGESVFVPLFEQADASKALPDFESIYRQLGISLRAGKVSLDEDHENAALRRGFAG